MDEFENDVEEEYKSELKTIYAYMDQVANLKSLPKINFISIIKIKEVIGSLSLKASI